MTHKKFQKKTVFILTLDTSNLIFKIKLSRYQFSMLDCYYHTLTIDGVSLHDHFTVSRTESHFILYLIEVSDEYIYEYDKTCIKIYAFALRKNSTTILDRNVG